MAIDTSTSMRWMTNNLLEAGVASFVVSSEHASYPLENVTDGSQRSKLFKFGGRFLIEAGENDKIYINSTPFTIPADDYNDLNSLLTAINTVLAGLASFSYDAETYVVSVSDATTFTLNLSTTTDAAWETLGFTGSVDVVVTGSFVESADEARIHWPYEEFTVDFGYQATIGFVGMIGNLASELRIPEGATITILGNTVNDFAAPPLSQTIPWYTTGAFKFIDDLADSAWRYVKVRIECPSGPFIPEIGYLYLGEYEKFDEKNIGTGFELNFDDPSELSVADSGAIYANTRTPYRVFSALSVGLARPEHAAFLKRIYKLKQKSTPFFVALDPTSYLSDSFDEHLAYVRFGDSPRYKHIIRNIFELEFDLREAL